VIRSARVDDLPVLGDIERAAGAAFRDLGMAAVADADPLSMSELTRFQADGRAWVVADEADRWALRRGLSALTLTTYADVPWNAPYYARLGFGIVADVELYEGLCRIREREEASGLAAWPRVVMRRPVGGPGF